MIKKGKATELSQGIADILSALRDKIGFTQRQMAEKIGVTVQQYQKYEKGKDRLPLERALVLCADLGVPLGTFMQAIEATGGVGFAEEEQAGFEKAIGPITDEEAAMAVFRSVPKKSRKEFLEAMRKMAKMVDKSPK